MSQKSCNSYHHYIAHKYNIGPHALINVVLMIKECFPISFWLSPVSNGIEEGYWQQQNVGQLTLSQPSDHNCHFANRSLKVAIRNVTVHQKIALGTSYLNPDIMLVCTSTKMRRICTKMRYTFIISDFIWNGGHVFEWTVNIWANWKRLSNHLSFDVFKLLKAFNV